MTLVFHIGYPKTGTSTLQSQFFPCHPEISYGGKNIEDYSYSDSRLTPLMRELMTANEISWGGGEKLKSIIRSAQQENSRKVLLYSSENFLHPETSDIKTVAGRLFALFPDARILMTLRSQPDLLRSFYRNHGAFGQYLFTIKNLNEEFVLPLSPEEWLAFQFMAPSKNVLGTLFYDKVLDAYCSYFGRQHVHVTLFESMQADLRSYLTGLSGFLGISPDETNSFLAAPRQNIGMTDRDFSDLEAELRGRYLRALGGVPVRWNPRKLNTEFPQDGRDRIRETFCVGNRRLKEIYGLPVDAFGYPM